MIVYILFSPSLSSYYVGVTNDVVRRLSEHNSGYTKFTSKGKPWEFVTSFTVVNRSEAYKLEKKIKKRGIRRYLDDIGFSG